MSRTIRLILLLALLITGCNSNNGGEEVAQGPLPQVFVFPGVQEERLISQEVIDLPNCTGNAESSQEVTRAHTVLYTVELGREITVSADGRAGIPGIGEVGVGAAVATNYQVGYGRSETVSRSQRVAAAPASHMQHTIQQFEIWETGELLIVAGENNQRIPYSFRRDFSIKAVAPANIGCPGSMTAPETQPETVNQEGILLPPTISSPTSASPIISEEGPFQEHYPFYVGTGVFSNATYSDGKIAYEIGWLDTRHPRIQSIRRETQPDGCDTAYYNAEKIWITGTPGMRLTKNGQVLGEYQIAADSHGYVIEQSVTAGDLICAENFSDIGFSIIFGPDIYYNYDSYCHRQVCTRN